MIRNDISADALQCGMPGMIELHNAEECAAVCRELGLQFVELNTNFPQYQLHALDAGELNRIAREYGIGYTIHLDDEMNVAEFNPYVAEAYRRTAEEFIQLAKKIGAKKINMHLSRGAKYTLPTKVIYFFEAYQQEYLANMRRFREACEEAIGDSGILICVENTNGFTGFQRSGLELLLESPVFGLTLDIGHNYCAGNVDEGWILDHADRLHHMHIHDAAEGNKDHRALGTGTLDLKKWLTLAQERDCTVVLETKTVEGLRESVEWLKK